MFFKDIGKSIQNSGFCSRIAQNIFYSKQIQQVNSQSTNLFRNNKFSFTSTVNLIKDKNPHVNTINQAIKIDWSQIKDSHSIQQAIWEYKIPTKIKYIHFYQIQEKLYIAIMDLEEQRIQNKLFQILVQLHNSSVENLSKLKVDSLYKHDVLFQNFCIALFKGQKLIKSRGSTTTSKVQNDLTFIQSLLYDKKIKSSFQTEIIPNLSFYELKECCNVVFQANLQDCLMKIITTKEPQLSKEFKEKLINDFKFLINPSKIQSLYNLQQFYEFHSNIVLCNNEQKYSQEQIEQSNSLCQQVIDVYFNSIISQKNLQLKISLIKNFLQAVKKSGIIVKKNQIHLLDKVINNTSHKNISQQDAVSELIVNLKQLNFNNTENEEIQNYLSSKMNQNVEDLISNEYTASKDIPEQQLNSICIKLSGVDNHQDIQNNEQFILLEKLINESLQVAQIINILVNLSKYNKIAAELLATQERKSIINQNFMFINQSSFSQILTLDDANILNISFDQIIQYITKNIEEFSPSLLVESFFKLVSSQKNKIGIINQFQINHIKIKYINVKKDTQKLREQVCLLIFKKQEQLQMNQINLLIKCLVYIKNESDFLIIQRIVEEQTKIRMFTDSRYINIFFNTVQHKILKQGLQSQYSIEKIELIEMLIKDNKIVIKYLDLFYYAQFIIAINKFTNSNIIFNHFIEVLKQQKAQIKTQELAYIYIASLISHIRLKNQDNINEIQKLEKYILNNCETKGGRKHITLVQITKIIHELVKTYNQLDQGRINFLENIYQKVMANYKLENDLGLSIWNLWQQSIISKDVNEFKKLFDKIKQNINLVVESELEMTNQAVKLKQYKHDMTQTVRELQKIQLYQSTMFYEVNENLYKKDEKLHCEIIQVKQDMDKCKSIQKFQKVQTVKHSSTFELNADIYLREAIKDLNLNYNIVCEKQIENIYFIDYFIEELNLCIECNGNQHYLANTLYYNEIIRNKYLKQKGYNIEIIQTSEFNQLPMQEQKTHYMNMIQKYQNKN